MGRITKGVAVGNVKIGAGAPITVQSMITVPLSDTDRALAQLLDLEQSGCEIARAAVPSEEDARALNIITKKAKMPIVADIHFDHRLAISSAKNGAAKIRINPGNIGGAQKVKEVVSCLKDLGIPVRIGVNGGSLEKELLEKHNGPTAQAMLESAESHIAILEKESFNDIIVSLKASDVPMTVEANRLFAQKFDYPLHLGVTEAGGGMEGVVAGSIGIGTLLLDGIGDTLRVSLTGNPVEEIRVGQHILKMLGLRKAGARIVSCPTCARCKVDLVSIAEQVKASCRHFKSEIIIAVMGCAVNGPGEAKHADIGVACGQGNGVLFKGGKIIGGVREEDIASAIVELAEELESAAAIT
ncbi:MAG: flavodoxin-dependent (E)-4-hydroxy-3-methylbut-2-enyl-diphosphate synthase [Eubacteriaceae bacterium]|nr:flavodoxin-dependent (E)-4-hydroxy-3-methylbut-2-enyl-diphosphate synthase [Eubacteriaceae bacterium]